ncbi:MAG: hypothetical protein ABR509_01545 [Candidatus Limnocylindria bacterium]
MNRLSAVAAMACATLAATVTVVGPRQVARAADPEYNLATSAVYRVDPDAGEIRVSVDVEFTNRTPDPRDGYTIFPEALLAIQDGASGVKARDAEGRLDVAVDTSGDADVVTVALRDPIRYGETAEFSLQFTLLDSAADGIRVRPSATVFPAWGFGTSSEVTVELPAGYRISVRGDRLTAEDTDESTTLTSGAIDAPETWVAIVTADRPTEFVTVQRIVPLESGTADLRVAAWSDDREWGTRTLDLLAEGLRVLERHIGLPYEHTGPLVVSESVSVSETGFDGDVSAGILIGFDQPPFTALHEGAHIWIGPNLFEARWIYEGFASYYAARAGAEIGVDPPYDPQVTADEHAAAAFPLQEWLRDDDPSSDRDAYGYPASWAVAAEIAERAGDDELGAVLQRIAAGDSAYAPLTSSEADGGGGRRVDSRAFLDQLEHDAARFDDLFRDRVFGTETAPLLETRADARASYDDLLGRAGEWGAPRSVADAMAAWDFAAATTAMESATEWLAACATLMVELASAELEVPTARLRSAYVETAGQRDPGNELAAERAFVAAYLEGRRLTAGEPGALAQVGLVGTSDAESDLDRAAERFGAGELGEARDLVDAVNERLLGAATAGTLRLGATGAVAAGGATFLTARAMGRRRRARRS